MNNLLSFCGLVDAKIRASDKDLPVFPLFPMSSPASRSANKLTWPELTQNVCQADSQIISHLSL